MVSKTPQWAPQSHSLAAMNGWSRIREYVTEVNSVQKHKKAFSANAAIDIGVVKQLPQ